MATQTVTIDISTGSRDRWFSTLENVGYRISRYRPGANCHGRIIDASGTTVHYEAEVTEVRLSFDPPQQEMVDTVVVYGTTDGGTVRG